MTWTVGGPIQQEKRSFIEAARRAQIVESAIATIADLGYARASLAQIAKRAGISKGIISYHFTGKDDLIEQTFRDIYVLGATFMTPFIVRETTATAMLRAYIESNLAFMRTHPQHIQVIGEIFMGFRDAEGKFPIDSGMEDPAIAALEGLLRRGQQDGEFRAFPLRSMARTIRAAIDAVPGEIKANPTVDLEAYARELADIFARATRADP